MPEGGAMAGALWLPGAGISSWGSGKGELLCCAAAAAAPDSRRTMMAALRRMAAGSLHGDQRGCPAGLLAGEERDMRSAEQEDPLAPVDHLDALGREPAR